MISIEDYTSRFLLFIAANFIPASVIIYLSSPSTITFSTSPSLTNCFNESSTNGRILSSLSVLSVITLQYLLDLEEKNQYRRGHRTSTRQRRHIHLHRQPLIQPTPTCNLDRYT